MSHLNPLTRTSRILISVGLLATLSACQQDMHDLKQYMQSVHDRPPTPVEPLPEIKPYVRFIYPGHELDPFDEKILAPTEQTAVNTIRPEANRIPEFLENYPLDSLRMVGTLNQAGQRWALIRIPDGAIHRVKLGNYMGKNHGKISKVEETRVTLQEIVDNGLGGYKERDNAIALSDPANAKP